jgi:hypothetical protein
MIEKPDIIVDTPISIFKKENLELDKFSLKLIRNIHFCVA